MPASIPQNKLTLYLIIIVGLAGGYMYHSQTVDSFSVSPLPIQLEKDSLIQFKGFEIDKSLASNSSYQSLQIFGELPVSNGNPGKSSLFSR